MNIVYLAEVMGVGGLPNYVIDLARAYQAAHPETTFTIAHMGESIGANLETDGLRIERIRTIADIAALKPDIVNVQLLSDLEILKGLFTLGVPLVRGFHDYTSTCLRRGKRRWPGDRCQRPLNVGCVAFGCLISPPRNGGKIPSMANLPAKIAERDLYLDFDAVMTGSTHMAGMLRKNGFAPERTHIVPYFSRFSEQAKTQKVAKPFPRTMKMLFTGQAVSGKGLEILVEALGGLKGDWHLDVYSEGPRLAPAKEKAAALGIAGNISFNGWVKPSQLFEAYKEADLFVLPSIWDDPGPLVGIEALSLGTAVAGFAVGGIPDYVLDGRTGVLVRDVSIKGLNKALQSCLDTPERLAVLGQGGQQLVRDTRSPETHIGIIHSVYLNILKTYTGNKKHGIGI